MVARRYDVTNVDRFQSAQYQHVATEVDTDGSVWAIFGDGTRRPSVFQSEEDMLRAYAADSVQLSRAS